MSRVWLTDVLDRELADMLGADRDRIADAVLDALPIRLIDAAIAEAALHQLRPYVSASERQYVARDVAGNAAMAVVGVLGDADVDEEISNPSAGALEGASK
jgi:hypothetical protein